MSHEAFYSALASAGPALFLGYVIEHRSVARNLPRKGVGNFLYLTGVVPTMLATFLAMTALFSGQDLRWKEGVAMVTYLSFVVGLCTLGTLLVMDFSKYEGERKK